MSDKLKGMHLYVKKTGYTHHGLGVGDNQIIHYSGFAEALVKGPICCVSIDEFSNGGKILIKDHPRRKHDIEASVQRAQDRLGEDGYSLWGNNCEHFVEWCIEGSHDSGQVDRAVLVAGGVVLPKIAGTVGKGVIRQSGLVKNNSGAGVMSGLASLGRTVGKGAAGGIVITAGATGAVTAVTLNCTVLKDDENLPITEREARKKGRTASYVGATASAVGSLSLVSAAGTVSGLSAAGITSGLAAIGGTVGGGMVAGTVIIAAAPAAITAAVGYGTYKFIKWITQ